MPKQLPFFNWNGVHYEDFVTTLNKGIWFVKSKNSFVRFEALKILTAGFFIVWGFVKFCHETCNKYMICEGKIIRLPREKKIVVSFGLGDAFFHSVDWYNGFFSSDMKAHKLQNGFIFSGIMHCRRNLFAKMSVSLCWIAVF